MPKIQDLRMKLQIEVIYAFVFNALWQPVLTCVDTPILTLQGNKVEFINRN